MYLQRQDYLKLISLLHIFLSQSLLSFILSSQKHIFTVQVYLNLKVSNTVM